MKTTIVRGVVREGLIVPLGDEDLPEGAHVEIQLCESEEDVAQRASHDHEHDLWSHFSEDSWATIAWGQG